MKKLILLSLLFIGFQNLSAQIYLNHNEWSPLQALVAQFNIDADKFINNEDAYVAKELKKSIWTMTSKMNFYSDKIVKAQTFDEGTGMSEKAKLLMTDEVKNIRLIRIDFTNQEVNTIARAAVDLEEMKAQLKAKSYTLNMGDPADKAFVKKYKEVLNRTFSIQNNNFEKAYKSIQ